MKLKAFDSFHVGYSHVKQNKECEDYSVSYNDPINRFFIAAVSDGHSDKNCFRSSAGSRFACEAAKEVLTNFCEIYLEAEMKYDDLDENAKERLKKSIKQCWDNKVEKDLMEHPLREEELEPLSEKVKALYSTGKALENIYGATFLATAICNDLCIILHIGDGVIMSISSEGKYIEPILYDEKSETGEPASICNSDLFLRENAFRCEFYREIPQAIFLTSDGIGDSLNNLQIREFIYTLLLKFEEKREDNNLECFNDNQQAYLDSCVSYYADKGHGVEDDCSIGGIYIVDEEIPVVSVPLDYAMELYQGAVDEHNSVISDYERRKNSTIQEIERLEKSAENELYRNNFNEWFAAKNKIEELKKILKTIIHNENEKKQALENKIALCSIYVERAGGSIDTTKLENIVSVDSERIEEDSDFISFKNAQIDSRREKEEADKAQEELRNREKELQNAQNDYKEATSRVVEAGNNEDVRMHAEQEAIALLAKQREAAAKYEAQKKAFEMQKVKAEGSKNKFISLFQSCKSGFGKNGKKNQ